MKRKVNRIISLLFSCVFIAGAFVACSNQSNDGSSNKESNTVTSSETSDAADATSKDAGLTDTAADLSGTITMAGSTSMEKLANAAAEAFMAKYPNVIISPEFTGSGAGLEALIAGTINIGNSSRSLTEEEKNAGAVENIVAIDGIAVILDTKNTITNLSKDQLSQIYTGAITNWKDVGGVDQPIVVIGREAGSGTRGAFEELLEIKDQCKYANEINSTGGVLAKVASTPGSIGYVSIDVLDDTVAAISVDSVAPTVESIKAGSYLLSRPFVMATKGEIAKQDELVQEFFKYLQSDEGKQLIQNAGLITVD